MSKRRGKEYEFPSYVKQKALSRAGYKSELSGESGKLEIHHRVSVQKAKHDGLPAAAIRSLANAVVVTQKEHKEIHRTQKPEYEQSAWEWLLSVIGKHLRLF